MMGADGAPGLPGATSARGRDAAPAPMAVRKPRASRFRRWLGQACIRGQGDATGARLARVPTPAILLGADLPNRPRHLTAAPRRAHVPVAIGPARDGGYYCLAFREPVPFLFETMEWGTDSVARETIARLEERGTGFAVLEELDDCDRPEDLARRPWLLE